MNEAVPTLADRSEQAERPVSAPIDQVRDLLFGDQQRASEQRLRNAERQIQELGNALRRLSERAERSHVDLQTQAREKHLQTQLRIEEVQRDHQERLLDQQRAFDQRLDQLQSAVTEMLDALDRDKVDQQQMAGWLGELATRMQRPAARSAERLVPYTNGQQH